MSSELEVLLAAINPAKTPPPAFDDAALLHLAQRHRLVPQVARVVESQSLRDAARSNALRNLHLFAMLADACACLELEKIPAIAIKGPVLAHLLHGDVGMRMCNDIDVLVPRDKIAPATTVLAQQGYRPTFRIENIERLLQAEHDLQLVHEDGTLLELHADIAQPHYSYHIPLHEWFDRSVVSSIAGRRIRMLAMEDNALLAVLHGTRHAWSRLDLVADVAAFTRREADWRRIMAQAQQAGVHLALDVALQLAREVGGSQLAMTGKAGKTTRKVVHRLLSDADPGYWETRLFDLRIRERWRDRIRYSLLLLRKKYRAAGWFTSG